MGTWTKAWPLILYSIVLGLTAHIFFSSCQLFSYSVMPINLEYHKVQHPLLLLSPPPGPDSYCTQLCADCKEYCLVSRQCSVDTILCLDTGVYLCLESGFDFTLYNGLWTLSLNFQFICSEALHNDCTLLTVF